MKTLVLMAVLAMCACGGPEDTPAGQRCYDDYLETQTDGMQAVRVCYTLTRDNEPRPPGERGTPSDPGTPATQKPGDHR